MTGADAAPRPRLTVVICTRNRASSLRRTLESVAAADTPDSGWELLVVDNGSTDTTGQVVAEFAGRLPIRAVSEPRPGLSIARNRGVAEARGEYLIWTDDDVIVDRGWITGYLDAFAAHPDAVLFAGRVTPQLEPPTPEWFARGAACLQELMAVREFAHTEALSPTLLPYGASYAVRADVQRRHPYDPDLGVAPGRRTGGEETSVALAILAEGLGGITVPAALVRHVIPADRQTLAYVREYYMAHGETYPIWPPARRRPLLGRTPPRLLLEIARTDLSWRIRRRLGMTWLDTFVMNARYRGVLAHIRRRG